MVLASVWVCGNTHQVTVALKRCFLTNDLACGDTLQVTVALMRRAVLYGFVLSHAISRRVDMFRVADRRCFTELWALARKPGKMELAFVSNFLIGSGGLRTLKNTLNAIRGA